MKDQSKPAKPVTLSNVGFELVATAGQTPATDVFYGRRLEPKGRAVLHGAGQDHATFQEYAREMGAQKPLVYMYYTGMKPDGKRSLADLRRKLQELDFYAVPQIGLGLPVEEILKGNLQAEMQATCAALIELGRPAYVRLGFEFNLNHKDPAAYAEAWRVFARLLRAQPGSDRIALAWCMTPDADGVEFMPYYPGDEYVDWWCFDPFTPQHLTHRYTVQFLDAAREHRFPVMIGESTPRWLGARQGELSWTVWFKRYFGLMDKNPHCKAFCYIAWEWSRMVEKSDSPFALHWWGDARVWKDEYVFGKWKEELGKPPYVHAGEETAILDLLGVRR